MEAIELNKLDSQFKFDVAAHPGGSGLTACFACGACTGGCPVSEVDPAYDPRKIIRMVLLGMKEKVLSSDLIWLCAMCYNCSFHCPQNVQFVKVMGVLREMAAQEGYVKPSFLNNMDEIDRFSQDLRHQLVISIVKRKSEDFTIDPKELVKQISDKF
ncbi:MAG: 4Fe-4S dicluster domain-containing protein [Proteobacteria bacterium]|nr:4Fe-4S dicluster domain-containing protein [Pseudomonadota bacterium]